MWGCGFFKDFGLAYYNMYQYNYMRLFDSLPKGDARMCHVFYLNENM